MFNHTIAVALSYIICIAVTAAIMLRFGGDSFIFSTIWEVAADHKNRADRAEAALARVEAEIAKPIKADALGKEGE